MGVTTDTAGGGPAEGGSPKRIAAFVDAENLLIASRDAGIPQPLSYLMSHVRSLGRVAVARAYGDWSRAPCSQYLRSFQSHIIELIQLATNERGKNTADIQLALDAMEMLLGPTPPELLVLACADRDFVPLVQKAKRYGLAVVGIGVRGSVSNELSVACDQFFMLDDLVPDQPAMDGGPVSAPGITETGQRPTTPTDTATRPLDKPKVAATTADSHERAAAARTVLERGAAFALFARVVGDLQTEGRTATGALAYERMLQAYPEFDFRTLGYERLRDFALDAERTGHVRVVLSTVSDFRVSPAQHESDVADQLPFGTPAEACESYRRILLESKRVPLVDYSTRSDLVRQLWQWLESQTAGATIVAMNDHIRAVGRSLGLALPDRAYEKIIHTLNIGKCFTDRAGSYYCTELYTTLLRTAVSVEVALESMHRIYVQGILWARDDVPVDDEGFAMLLFGDEYKAHLKEVERLLDRLDA